MSQQPVHSPGGTMSVLTTERGLPVGLRLAADELQKSPHQLASDIMALCRLSAMRAQVARRRALLEKGYDAAVIRNLALATEEDLARAQADVAGDEDELPISWQRQV